MILVQNLRELLNPGKVWDCKMKNIKPIYMMVQEDVSLQDINSIISGLEEMIYLAGVDLQIINLEDWAHEDYLRDGSLRSYHSLDWYIEHSRYASRNNHQLDVSQMLIDFRSEPWRDIDRGGKDHYDVVVVSEDIYMRDIPFLIGLADENKGTVLSTKRFQELDQYTKSECLKTEAMHEIGHVFGLIPPERISNVEESIGKHCTNRCIMRQGLSVPRDWIILTEDRINYGALCQECERDLRNHFI